MIELLSAFMCCVNICVIVADVTIGCGREEEGAGRGSRLTVTVRDAATPFLFNFFDRQVAAARFALLCKFNVF